MASHVPQEATEAAIRAVETAGSPKELFGADPAKRYHELSKVLHPDVVAHGLKARAHTAFARMSTMYASLNGKKPAASPTVIGKWAVADPIAKGDICDLYQATFVDDEKRKAVFKIARSPRDRDLMDREASALKALHAARNDNFKKYVPALLDVMEASGRRANVLTVSKETHTLAELMGLFPKGIDFRHIVWMGNRALSALGFAHRSGIAHGAVLPEHLIYGPASHGLTLVDWCYSVTFEGQMHIPAMVKARKALYPPEVARKDPPAPGTDIYMLMASLKLAAHHVPKRFQPLFDWAAAGPPKSRPGDAWELQDRWGALAKEEFGPPQYLKMELPIT